jgi:energy-coupling factor transporter ATP-binding protein EcfA2
MFGCVVSNLLDQNPVNLYIIGPSGSGKTELIQSMFGFNKIFPLSDLTPNTFVSGYGGKYTKGEDSLLNELSNTGVRVIAIKEFSGILGLRHEKRMEIIKKIREIADGRVDSSFGNKVRFSWKGHLGFIIGTTSAIYKESAVNHEIGERFVYFRIFCKDRKKVAAKSEENASTIETIRKELEDCVTEFLSQFIDPFEDQPANNVVTVSNVIKDKFINLCDYVSMCRSNVSRNRFTRVMDYMPEIESPARLAQQLKNLACGIALVQDKKTIDTDIYRILAKIAHDSIHPIRGTIIQMMWDGDYFDNQWSKHTNICQRLCLPHSTATYYLEEMEALSMMERRMENGGLEWRMEENLVDMIVKSEAYKLKEKKHEKETDEW